MSRLRKSVVPFSWNTITASYTQGTASSVNLASYLTNGQSKPITYFIVGTPPTGVSLVPAGSPNLAYNGTSPAATAQVQIRASSGPYVAESATVTVLINAAPVVNQAPVWSGSNAINLGEVTQGNAAVFPLAGYASDIDGPQVLTFGRTGSVLDTAGGLVTVGSTYPANATFPNTLAPGTYTIEVYAEDGYGLSSGADGDWAIRAGGAGVVWAHDFRTQSEVDAFRVPTGSNPDAVSWVSTDGIGSSKTLQVMIPQGMFAGQHYEYYNSVSGWIVVDNATLPQPAPGASNAEWTWVLGDTLKAQGKVADGGWWRPFSAVAATQNGKTTADPAANGTLPLRPWTSAHIADSGRMRAGYYAHSSYSEICRTWPAFGGGAQTNAYDGSEFYIQFRVKLGTWRNGNLGLPATDAAKTLQFQRFPAGKLVFVGTTGGTPLQEIVIRSQPVEPRQEITGSRFAMYTAQGSSIELTKQKTVQGSSVTVLQPGGAYDDGTLDGTCYYNGNYAVRDCWYWPVEEWVTVLIHVIPGRQQTILDANPANANNFDTGVEVWVARSGETSYTQIVGIGATHVAANTAFPFYFDTNGLHPNAWNSFLPTGYMNNAPSLQAFYQRFTQIIFSKNTIPCPQA